MGKVYQLLNRREHSRQATPAEPNPLDHRAVPVAPPAEASDEVPFIEVGPRKSLEASPCVLATAPGAHARDVVPSSSLTSDAVPETNGKPSIPESSGLSRAPQLVTFHQPDTTADAWYRHFLARMTLASTQAPARLLFFSAASAAAEAATVSVVLNLAMTAARRYGRSVIVVDADVPQPRIAQELGLKEHPGLGEVLAGERALEAAVQATTQENLSALTAGRGEQPGAVRFVAATVCSVLRQLRQRYDFVLVRGPRWDSGAAAQQLAQTCDAVFPVLPTTGVETAPVDELLQAIPQRQAKLTGCIVAS
jgi:Mrp family chromosome partitioning ATPase